MRQGAGGRLLAGFVVLHVLCCGLPLLVASGVLSGAGALLTSPVLLTAGAVVAGAAVLVALRRARRSDEPPCCSAEPQVAPAQPS